jgi:predicted Zn-dependent protease
MTRAITHFAILAICFFGTWFVLSKINYRELFEIDKLTKENERRLGGIILDAVKKNHQEIVSDSALILVNGIKNKLCEANNIQDSSVTLNIFMDDDVNAFALPARYLIINTGLIEYCKTPEELAGVIAHEIAHMEHHHVMKKLLKGVGLSMLMTIAGGESGGEILRETIKLLSSTAFDREQESEADASAVHLMAAAGIDPEQLANFLFRLSQEKDNVPKHFEWLATHPNSQDRSAEILKLRKHESFNPHPIANNDEWIKLQKHIKE